MARVVISTLLVSIAFFLSVAYSQDVVSFAVTTFRPLPPDLFYRGDAHIPGNANFLRLTDTRGTGRYGAEWSSSQALYSKTIQFWDKSAGTQRSFETTVEFRINPIMRGAADGITFFIAPTNQTLGRAGASFGLFDEYGVGDNIFAVEFDTKANAAEFEDGRHIGIDINSRRSRAVTPFDCGTGQRVKAHITYDPETSVTRVNVTSGSKTAELSYKQDLTEVLTEQVLVGLSSATSDVVPENGIHDIYTWSFTSTPVKTSTGVNDGGGEKNILMYSSESTF